MTEEVIDGKKKYLNLSDDIDQIRYGHGAKEKTFAGLKILGKSIFNVTKFAINEAAPKISAQVERNKLNK